MFDIHRETIQFELRKLNNLISIVILNAFNVHQTVWLQKENINGFWAKDLFGNDYKIFPSKSINILKIGGRVVQSMKSYKEEKEIYFEVIKNQRQNLYKQAYKHSKQLN